MTMTPEQQNIVDEAINLLIQEGSLGMADFFRRIYEIAMQLERQQFMNAAPYQPKFSSWSKTELWQVVDVEPMPVFGKFYNGQPIW